MFAEEIGVSGPCPKTSRHKATLGIFSGPGNVCTRPFVLVDLAARLEVLERPLLIIGSEFASKIDDSEGCENVVGGAKRGRLL